MSLFQPNCDKTSELASKVLVYYHPKVSECMYLKLISLSLSLSQACRDDLCVNLSPQYISEKKHTGLFYGDPYVTWDVKVGVANILKINLYFYIVRMC